MSSSTQLAVGGAKKKAKRTGEDKDPHAQKQKKVLKSKGRPVKVDDASVELDCEESRYRVSCYYTL